MIMPLTLGADHKWHWDHLGAMKDRVLMYLVFGSVNWTAFWAPFADWSQRDMLHVAMLFAAFFALSIDPIVFGVLVVRMVGIGLMTPRVGLNVYVLKGGANDTSMPDIFRGYAWFVFVDIINVAILLAFLQIILLVPLT